MKYFGSSLITHYKNSSLQSKLLFAYFLFIFVPIVLLSWYSISKSTEIISEQSVSISKSYLSQTSSLVKNSLQRMDDVSSMLANRSDIKELLMHSGKAMPFSEEYDAMSDLFETVASVKELYDVYRIRIYIDDSFVYHKSNYITYSMSSIVNTPWFNEMEKGFYPQIILPPYDFSFPIMQSEKLISICTPIRSIDNITKILGVVMVDMQVDKLTQLLKTAKYTADARIFLVNSKNEMILSTAETQSDFSDDMKELLEKTTIKYPKQENVLTSGTQMAGISEPIYSDWRIFMVSSYAELLSQSNGLKKQLIVVTFFVGVIVYLMAYLYAGYNTKRVKILSEQIKKVESGDFHVNCIVDSSDEIGELQDSFNFMVRKIGTLLEDRYRLGKNLKGMELKALQAQINPHFLYNTLDLISWKAKKAGNNEIVDIVWQLARFYRLSLSNGEDFIPIEDELEHIRLYVQLQNLRLSDTKQILLNVTAQKQVEKLPIMKLILQPIVENSIMHGLLGQDDKQGEISIFASIVLEYVVIEIKDNGVGIDKSRLNSLRALEKLGTPSSSGYGLSNIRERLKIYYDDNFDFDIKSTVNVGTSITVRIPIQLESVHKVYIEKEMEI